jgi:leader peptidase (prepilin peptidase)/N-methyltransferase
MGRATKSADNRLMNFLMLLLVAAFGLVMGSAVTSLAHRVPRDRSWVRGRSACTSCGAQLGALDLVPLFSFLASRGRCRHCGARIGWRYPITEVLCAAWAVLLFRAIGLTASYPFLALWGFLLIALMWIDLDFQLLPDVLTFPGTLVALAAALQWPQGAHHALLGVLAGSGLLWALAWAWEHFRRMEGMGGGDIKLAAMFGVVLGWKLSLLAVMLAAFAGSVWGLVLISRGMGNGKTALPFGTLLAPAALFAFLYGEELKNAYLHLFAGG